MSILPCTLRSFAIYSSSKYLRDDIDVNVDSIIGIVFHLLIWHIDDMLANAVMVSILGLLVGPTYPLILDIATNPRTKHKGVSATFQWNRSDSELGTGTNG